MNPIPSDNVHQVHVLLAAAVLALGCGASNPYYSGSADLSGDTNPPASMDAGDDGAPATVADMTEVAADSAPGVDLAKAADLLPAADLACSSSECTPGDSQLTPDGCGRRVCGTDCHWGAWQLKVGNECYTGNVQSCNAGINCPHAGTQQCVACGWNPCTC